MSLLPTVGCSRWSFNSLYFRCSSDATFNPLRRVIDKSVRNVLGFCHCCLFPFVGCRFNLTDSFRAAPFTHALDAAMQCSIVARALSFDVVPIRLRLRHYKGCYCEQRHNGQHDTNASVALLGGVAEKVMQAVSSTNSSKFWAQNQLNNFT